MILSERPHINTLYVHRPLVNADQVRDWALGQGFQSTLPRHDMHVTIAFSKKAVPWHLLEPILDHLQIDGGHRAVSPLGDKGAVVLHFDHPHLHERWQHFVDHGATWEHPGYKPHVTITYDGAGMPLHNIMPYDGPLVFGPEEFKPLDLNWDQKIQEVPLVVEKRGVLAGKSLGSVKYGKSIMEMNRMTELSTLLMKNIDLILDAYRLDESGALVVANKRKVNEADEVFHEYFVKSMNHMFRRLNENDPIMHQPDGMGMDPHGQDDLGIADGMEGDMSPMGMPHAEGPHGGMMMGGEPGMEGHPQHMHPGHGMHPGHAQGLPPHMHGMNRPFDPTTQFESTEEGEYDWLHEEVDDLDINSMFDITEDEQVDEENLNEFGGMGMDMEGGHNDFGGDMGGAAMDGGDNMDLGSSLDGMDDDGMGGNDMGGDDMVTIHGKTDSGSPFDFSFVPDDLGYGDEMNGMGGGDEHHGHEGHEEHHGGFDHSDEPGMGEEEDESQVAEAAAFHNGKPRRSKGPRSARMSVVPANPAAGHAAPFPTPQGAKQKR